jgi:hypothetical protein
MVARPNGLSVSFLKCWRNWNGQKKEKKGRDKLRKPKCDPAILTRVFGLSLAGLGKVRVVKQDRFTLVGIRASSTRPTGGVSINSRPVLPATTNQKLKRGFKTPFFVSGSPGRTRTAGQVVNSHPLYLLSYRGMLLQNAYVIKIESYCIAKSFARVNRKFVSSKARLRFWAG